MKRFSLWALAALALVACTVEEVPQEEPETHVPEGFKVLTIQASRDAGTKTSYAGEVTFSWSAGDKISVLCNDGSKNFWQTFTATTAAKTSVFEAVVPSNVQMGPKSSSEYRVALFPANENHVYNGPDNISFAIPAERDFRASSGGHFSADIPMFAWGNSSNSYAFANLTGAAKFTFVNIPCQHVKFTFQNTGSARLNGLYALSRSGSININNASNMSMEVVAAANDSQKKVSYYADVVDGSASFYVPCPKETLWAWNHVCLENADTGESLYSNTNVKDIKITKNRVSVIPALDVATGSIATNPSGSVSFNKNYTESTANISNPERGLYKMVEYKYHKRDDNENPTSKYTSTTETVKDSYYQCYQDQDHTNTLVMTLFYMMDYVSSDHFDNNGISYVRNVLTNIRSKGMKAIVRFAYNPKHPSSHDQEPTLARIQNHLADLTQTFADFEDVIYVVQAGFIGTYGEWYYTTNFGPSSGGVDYTISNNKVSGYENRGAVITALLNAIPSSRQIALRTPEYKACYTNPNNLSGYEQLSGFGTDAAHRLAFHNDAFLYGGSSHGDMGTYHYDWSRPMWSQQGAYLINGGEAPYSSTSVSQMDGYTYANVMDGIFNYHYSYLHHDTGYHSSSGGGSTLMRHWHDQGWMVDIAKWLGYRLYLSNASVSGNDGNSGSTLSVSLTLKNSGAAPVVNVRPMKLVLLHNGTPTVLKEDVGDIRLVPCATLSGTTITPGSKTYSFSLTLPQTICIGDQLALWLPDQDPNGQGLQSRAEYSIRLANNETSWTSGGYNVFYTF